jgi:lipopolysaccharide transport system permease protein
VIQAESLRTEPVPRRLDAAAAPTDNYPFCFVAARIRLKIVLDHFAELYKYRVLIESLVWRDIKARYRGSVFGFLWTFLNPLILLLVYRAVFKYVTQAVDIPYYAVFLFVGLLPWLWLAGSATNGSIAITQNGALIARACIPPQVLPAVVVLSNLVNFLLALPVAIGAAIFYQLYPTPWLVLLPLVIAIMLVFLYGTALFLSTVTVYFRDVQFLVQNLVLVWFFLTPIAYDLAQAPAVKYRHYFLANPATALLVPFQQLLYHRTAPDAAYLGLAAAWAIVATVVGIKVFEAMRDTVVEEL